MKFAIAFIIALPSFAQIAQPNLGTMLTRGGDAIPVIGVAGSATLRNPVATSVIASACARELCLFKTETTIVSPTGNVDAPEGSALISISSPSTAFIYFTSTRQLMRWENNLLTSVDFDVTGDIIALGSSTFAVRRPAGIWIVRDHDVIVRSLPRGIRALLLLDDAIVYATQTEVTIGDQHFSIANVESLIRIGENYVQARTHDVSFAIRIDRSHEQAFQLPEPQP